MGQMAETLRKVRRLVERLEPAPACGSCLADRIDSASESEVQLSLSKLAAERGFARDNAACGLCGEHRPVIRKRK